MADGRRYHETLLNDIVRGLGREDVGIGDAVRAGRNLYFTIWKGRNRLRSQIPFRTPLDRVRVAADLSAALAAFNRLMTPGWRRPAVRSRLEAALSIGSSRAVAVSR